MASQIIRTRGEIPRLSSNCKLCNDHNPRNVFRSNLFTHSGLELIHRYNVSGGVVPVPVPLTIKTRGVY